MAKRSSTKPIIFISHISEESHIASALKLFIEDKFLGTVKVFASSHEESIKVGDDWFDNIKQSIMSCNLAIVLCSPISINRAWINFEAGATWSRGIPVVPVCHSGMSPRMLPAPMNFFQSINLNNAVDMEKLFARIAEILQMRVPNLGDESFFKQVNDFENQIKSSSLMKDVTFIHNLLHKPFEELKISIILSFIKPHELNEKGDINPSDLLKFNNMHHILDMSLRFGSINKLMYVLDYENYINIIEPCKFVMLYSSLVVPDDIRDILAQLISMKPLFDSWRNDIVMFADSNQSVALSKSMMIEWTGPVRKIYSHSINPFIECYSSLITTFELIEKYETIVNKILTSSTANNIK